MNNEYVIDHDHSLIRQMDFFLRKEEGFWEKCGNYLRIIEPSAEAI
jgi:hypothetical protein